LYSIYSIPTAFSFGISGVVYSDVFGTECYEYSGNIPSEYLRISPNITNIPASIPRYSGRNIRFFFQWGSILLFDFERPKYCENCTYIPATKIKLLYLSDFERYLHQTSRYITRWENYPLLFNYPLLSPAPFLITRSFFNYPLLLPAPRSK
jgi:hypothetical protein